MSQSRQLAAIMFTDIVGYTTMMGRDEQKAFRLLKQNRQIQQPLIKYYRGTWIKELGDGVLASFHTVTDAVLCAAAIHNACKAVEGLHLRIGIHLGEVVFEDHDVFGDGVNIASRLQALAPVGGTMISEAVYKNVQNKMEFNTEFIREENLKNVNEPVKIYEIKLKEGSGYLLESLQDSKKEIESSSGKKKKIAFVISAFLILAMFFSYFLFIKQKPESAKTVDSTTEKSIAVLPFVNMSDDPQQEYFSDGLSEELINMFTRLPELKVTGRTSSFAFKGKNEDLRNIGKKLGVEYLLEGSVRKSGSNIRITVQLINANEGTHLWSETYNREMNDIFAVQDQISSSVTDALRVTLLNKDRPSTRFKVNPEAYNDFLQGRFIYESFFEPSNSERAMQWFKEAIKKDSAFSLAWTYLSMTYWRQSVNSDQREFKEAKRSALRALKLDPASGIAAVNVAEILENEYDFHGAQENIDLALKLEPENPYVLRNAGRFYTILGRKEKAIAFCKSAVEKDPIQRSALLFLARAFYYGGLHDEAYKIIKKYSDLYNKSQIVSREYFDILIENNDLSAARAEAEKINNVGLAPLEQGLPLYVSAVINGRLGNRKEADHADVSIDRKTRRQSLPDCACVR